jgi:hypothetical protein
MDWIHDELKDGLDPLEIEMGKKFIAPYKGAA